MTELFTIENLVALGALAALEIVLGIDNIVFIAILTGRLDPAQRARARTLGLLGAAVMRILLLLIITRIMALDQHPLFTFLDHPVTWKDIILLLGGLFLIAKATFEIHDKIEGPGDHGASRKVVASFSKAVVQIMLIDIVFSIDSVITAVGMVSAIPVMITAVLIAVGVMIAFSGAVSAFIERHATLKMLALAFLLLIGVLLVAEGLGKHISRGYVYFAMGFSLAVELLNIRAAAARALATAVPPKTSPPPPATT